MDGLAGLEVLHDGYVAGDGEVLLHHAENHLAVGHERDLAAARVRVHCVAAAGPQRHQRLPIAVTRQRGQERVLQAIRE